MALLLALSGCSTADLFEEPNVAPPVGEQIEEPTPTRSTTPPEAKALNLSGYIHTELAGPGRAGLTPEQQAKVRKTVVSFYNVSRNQSKRREASLNAATELCEYDRGFEGQAKASAFKAGGSTAKTTSRRLDFAAQIVNEKLGGSVERAGFSGLRDGVKKTTKYVPLLGSYNDLAQKSCLASKKRTNESIEEFHIAALMFGVDAALVAGTVYYQPAFAGTRFVANSASKLGLYRLRYLCGNRCWALAMSEVHWAMRGTMLGVTSNLGRAALDMGLDLSEEDVRSALGRQGYEPGKYLANSEIDFRRLSDCASDSRSSVRTAVNEVEDGGGDGGVELGDVAEEGESVLNQAESAVENQSVGPVVNRELPSKKALQEACPGVIVDGE